MSVEVHKTSQYVVVTIREDIKKPQLDELMKCFHGVENEKELKAIVLDMVGVGSCEEFCLQEIVRAAQKFKERNVYVFVVRLAHAMQSKIQRGGLSQILIYRHSIDDALNDVGIETKTRHKLDSEFIKPVLDSAVKVISEKSKLECKPGHLFNKKEEDKFKPDVILVFGIVSSTFNGSLAIAFQSALFNVLTTNIAGEAETGAAEEDSDTGNRLLSVIHKRAAAELAPQNHFIQQFIPLVIRGENLIVTEVVPDPVLIIPYSSDKGPFQIYIGLN